MNNIYIEIGNIKLDYIMALYILLCIVLFAFVNILLWPLFVLPAYFLTKRTVKLEIDPIKKKMRRVVSLFKYTNYNDWQKLPEIEYLLVSKAKVSTGRGDNYKQASTVFQQYSVRLIVKSPIRYITLKLLNNYEDAIELGLRVAKELQIDVLDKTTKEKQWIKKGLQTG